MNMAEPEIALATIGPSLDGHWREDNPQVESQQQR